MSMVLVITVMSVVIILAVILLSLSLVTFRMKSTYSSSNKNFYNAESVLDDIQTGLQKDVSDASGVAYAYMLERYSTSSEAVRKANYGQSYYEAICKTIEAPAGAAGGAVGATVQYDLAHLNAMVSDEVKSGATNLSSADTPLLSSSDGNCTLNLDPTTGTLVIKNLLVTYVDKKDFMTQIRTDIVLTCPELSMAASSATPLDLPSYIIVAGDKTEALKAGDKVITGNAYLGDNGAEFSLANINFLTTASSGKLITKGQLYVRNKASVTVGSGFNLWAREVKADSADSVSLKGTTYLNDDLVIENSMGVSSVNVNLSGRFYAYGNAENVADAQVFGADGEARTQLEKNPASYSSAILINGRNANLDMSKLSDMIISGTAYVGTESESNTNSNVQMGNSISLKSDQRAYLVPSEFLASYCVAGGRNPMTESAYDLVLTEIAKKLYGNDKTKVQDKDFLRESETSDAIPSELQKLHVKGVKKQVYQLNLGSGTVNMIYFFLEFDSEEDAIAYGNTKYAIKTSTLEAQLDTGHYNTTITYPSMMYEEFSSTKKNSSINDFTFYYNGGLIVPATDKSNTTVKVGQKTMTTSSNASSLKAKEVEYQDTFAALYRTLSSDYTSLASVQKTRDLYDNLVYDMTSANVPESIPAGSAKVFSSSGSGVAAGSEMAAVVVNGDYTLTGTETAGGKTLPVHLVIASGNVTVTGDFTGLILAGGKVTLETNAKNLTANTALVTQALQLTDANGNMPLDYLIDGENYLSATGGSGTDSGGSAIDYAENVTFRNWSKQ